MALFVDLTYLLLSPRVWALVGALTLVWLVSVVVYRRFFHPLAKIPGPALAAVTTLYQSYYNRRYFLKIAELHKKYGPVVRITPNEVHLSDVENYEKIYHMGSRYYKSPEFYNAFCIPGSLFTTIPNGAHKVKRAALNPMFSRKMVLDLEEVVQSKARKLIDMTSTASAQGVPIDLHHAFRCVSVDVITDYAFNRSYDLLDKPDLGAQFFALVRGVGPVFWAFQQLTFMSKLAIKIPPWIASKGNKPLAQVNRLKEECLIQIQDVKCRMDRGEIENEKRPTIFSELLNYNADGFVVPTSHGLTDDAYSILAAAADTTGNTMTIAAFNVMSNRQIYESLRNELFEAFPDPNTTLDFATLERLPYLTGVIKEGLRLAFAVPGRLPRVVPEPGAVFNGHFVPGGSVVGMSSWILHRDETAFPNHMEFKPERWLDPDDFRRLDKYLVPFGRGNRMCIGMPLAYCELYVTIGTLFHRFESLDVYKTTRQDLIFDDFFSAYHIPGKHWLKAVDREKY